jgi:CRISPR-associated endonuclease/helicase Cas3
MSSRAVTDLDGQIDLASIGAPTFDEFLLAVRKRTPFPWQRKLANQLARGENLDWLIVPTGLGKTSIIDAWCWALAVDLVTHGVNRSMPTRLIFVVNRRGIVDDSFRYAEDLASSLKASLEPDQSGTLHGMSSAARWVATQLQASGALLENPLEVVRMRGGVSWDWRWLRQPDQPAVISSTVDQFGSRLLFRGYGVGDRIAPIDAALVSQDALVVLDEAHLSEPLADTILSVQNVQSKALRVLLPTRPLRFLRMTATPPPAHALDGAVLRLGDEDRDDEFAGERYSANKQLNFVEVTSNKKDATKAIVGAAVAATKSLLIEVSKSVSDPTVVVILNTVRAARATLDQLVSSGVVDKDNVALVIGQSRSFERDENEKVWRERISAGRIRGSNKPFVLVATQTVEVGADIDADALVTEACALDSLVQRLGRLDRLGKFSSKYGVASAVLLWNLHRHGTMIEPKCPVYSHASTGTWDTLRKLAGPFDECTTVFDPLAKSAVLRFGERLTLAVGPSDLAEITGPTLNWSDVRTVPLRAPILLPGAVASWARTSPKPVPDRDVAPYLHGPGRGEAEVLVCWRNLGTAQSRSEDAAAIDELSLLLPTASECVTLRLSTLIRFVFAKDDAELIEEGDTVAAANTPSGRPSLSLVKRIALQNNGGWEIFDPKDPKVKLRLRSSDLAGQSIVVIDCAEGGHDQYGWSEEATDRVDDVGDLIDRKSPALRISLQRFLQVANRLAISSQSPIDLPDVEPSGSSGDNDQLPSDSSDSIDSSENDVVRSVKECWKQIVDALNMEVPLNETSALIENVSNRLTVAAATSKPNWYDAAFLRQLSAFVKSEIGSLQVVEQRNHLNDDDEPIFYPNETLVLRPAHASSAVGAGGIRMQLPNDSTDDSDDGTSRTASDSVLLKAHLAAVAKRASLIAKSLGLSDDLTEVVRLSADLHDLGKADWRFQTLLRNNDWTTAQLEDGSSESALAKSPPGSRYVARSSAVPIAAQWPIGKRHEAVSAELLSASPGWRDRVSSDNHELVLHLVASHHGYARPMFPPVLDEAPASATFHHDGMTFSTEGTRSSIDWSSPQRFDRLGHAFSPWGLAMLEAIVRLADIWVSQEGG